MCLSRPCGGRRGGRLRRRDSTRPTPEVILKIILYAQLRGNNQNVIKLLGAGMPANPEAGEIRIVKATKLSALIDGGWNQGMTVVARATALALEKAAAHGFGIVGTRRTNSPTGAIGYFARQLGGCRLDRIRLLRLDGADGDARVLRAFFRHQSAGG